ncbi:MAG TPA: hypothetical protein VFT69_15000 [Pseudolabrys sp.]|nr:hypothetical protein [Pseudolabrys sp.]
MRFVRVLGLLGMALAVSACAQSAEHLSTTYLDRYATLNPTPASFTECHGFGCAEVSHVSLSPHQWRRVTAVFRPRAANAGAERRQVARAVALMQRLVGAQTGTAVHQWTHKNLHVLPNLGSDPSQLDCIDESVNTWTYMTMMERDHLFHFHRVAGLSYAGLPTDRTPRNTAVLREKGGGYFAIDPSLVDAGVPPPIIPLETWLGSWPPKISES